MPNLNRNGKLSLGLVTAVCLFALAFVFVDHTRLQAVQYAAEEYQAHEEANYTNVEIEELCTDASGSAQIGCVEEKIESRNQRSQESRDLNAQERMAFWAKYMFYAAALGTVAAVYGLFLLRETWSETRRTADIAQEAFLLSERPHVFIGDVSAEKPLFTDFQLCLRNPDVDHFTVLFGIENHGKTPAIISEMCARVHIGEHPPETPEFHSGEMHKFEKVVAAGSAERAHAFYRGTISDSDIEVIMQTRSVDIPGSEKLRVFLYVKVRYGSVLGVSDEVMSAFWYDPIADSFWPIENPAYNYRRLGKR